MEERIPEPQDPTADVAADVLPAEASSSDVTTTGVEEESDSDGEFEFEFPFVSRDSPAGTAAVADDLFADGRIKPFYPVFGRAGAGGGGDRQQHLAKDDAAATVPPRTRGPLGRLFLEESRGSFDRWSTSTSSSSSSSAPASDEGGLDGAPPESYCLWTPGAGAGSASASASPRPPRKSGSTGSMARWRRISELVVGRSHSDGKEKFLFLPIPPPSSKENDVEHFKPKPKPPKPTPASGRKTAQAAAAEIDTVAAIHRIAYGAKGGGATGTSAGGGTPRRTFLPYREELVGLFANVNGISRSHPHPF
ncbi:uncharacterized protein [Oryza sativa Japonica Group]|uniref:Os05g0578100 protein n=3 Tax=Oryza TaxID=4527 RepID=A0A0N7KLA8_ORYSJ|nr:uncharacterized protein LOC4339706 [Oryza sativa Japonica Group]KAB8100726.1 hypothetical protein EE612_031315 [Oryza sativa]AAT39156.1 unknown protein [Oryza sativa Japonica Group]KAF2932273.1 hypothetical protein DAI22_05g275100 [Oryza sativa Japonica Group]BAF18326.1 Os05g0578100 [Oryza sativa Japonica Group]BAS95497.1 Os05g0578100 [Oryza sativa Japonica Group]|eukprot:NP_001056412.1 Os05g0578100 [Oryza sativa Japonica Group]